MKTSSEFNEKYKDYLEEDFYGLAINSPKVVEYLDGIFSEFIKIPGFKYSQIKMKFDSVRFYCIGIDRQEKEQIELEIYKLV